MFEVTDFEEQWKCNESYDKGVLMFIPECEIFIRASMGTGDNLSEEDLKAGYNDYIYIEELRFERSEFDEVNGAQLLFNNQAEDYYINLKHFCDEAVAMLGFLDGCNYKILQLI